MNFYDLLKLARNEILNRSKEALNWYKDSVLNAPNKKNINPTDLLKPVGSPQVGSLYFFKYDAKHKDKLPYWDMYPVIVCLGPAKGGFYGLNFHYLPPAQRAGMLNALSVASGKFGDGDNKGTDRKLNVSYQIIQNAKISGYEQCIKHYLNGRYSNMRMIAPDDWEKIVMLPLQKWVVRTGFRAPY